VQRGQRATGSAAYLNQAATELQAKCPVQVRACVRACVRGFPYWCCAAALQPPVLCAEAAAVVNSGWWV